MTESLQRVWDDVQSVADERNVSLQRKLSDAEAKSITKQSDSLEVAKRQWLAERIDLERQLEDTKRNMEETVMRASREKAQLIDSERTLREQMKMLQERLNSSGAESR